MGEFPADPRLGRQCERRRPAAQQSAEEVEGVVAALPAGAPEGHQHRLGAGAHPGAIAAPDLAEDDAKANGQLTPPVGGVQARDLEEGQQVVVVVPQVLGEAVVGLVGFAGGDGGEQLIVQVAAANREAMRANFPSVMPVAEVEGLVQQLTDAAWETHRAATGGFQQVVATP